jgi:hypothetical protein
LHALDDENLSSIILNDTGTVTSFHAQGRTASDIVAITITGLHALPYYLVDKAGNKERPHLEVVGVANPDLSDLKNLVTNSAIDNPGIENALIVKIEEAQDQLAANQSLAGLNALTNQLNVLAGKHGLDQTRVDLMRMIISAITA